MPRIRTIKPEAPQHRKVGRLSDRAFRLWIVMLTQADDEGRLVADPEQLRLLAFGYHLDVLAEDSERALRELAESSLVILYEVSGTRYAYFPSWRDHQRIDKPTPSRLPAYSDDATVRVLVELSQRPRESSPNARRGLDPDRKDRKGSRTGREGEEGSSRGTTTRPHTGQAENCDGVDHPSRDAPELTPKVFMQSWNEICASEGLPAVEDLSNGRRKKIARRLRTYPTVEFWERVFNGVIRSEFLMGRKHNPKHPNWRATIDWLIENDENPLKVVEGTYA